MAPNRRSVPVVGRGPPSAAERRVDLVEQATAVGQLPKLSDEVPVGLLARGPAQRHVERDQPSRLGVLVVTFLRPALRVGSGPGAAASPAVDVGGSLGRVLDLGARRSTERPATTASSIARRIGGLLDATGSSGSVPQARR